MLTIARRAAAPQADASIAAREGEPCRLTLFVSGASEASARAIADVREICDAHLRGRHGLKIVDLNQDAKLAVPYAVQATPTLVRDHPPPVRMVVGDMSDHERILAVLELAPAAGGAEDRAQVLRHRGGS